MTAAIFPPASAASPDTGGGLLPARPLAAQAHALRAAAAFIEQAGIPGLALTIDEGQITIQVPAHLAGPASRTAAVTLRILSTRLLTSSPALRLLQKRRSSRSWKN